MYSTTDISSYDHGVQPNMKIAPDGYRETVEVCFDVGSKQYGLRKSTVEIKDGVYLHTSKSIMMTYEQLKKLSDEIPNFLAAMERQYK